MGIHAMYDRKLPPAKRQPRWEVLFVDDRGQKDKYVYYSACEAEYSAKQLRDDGYAPAIVGPLW